MQGERARIEREKMKKETIVWASRRMNKNEINNFEKEHPGMRLSVFLRFPNAQRLLAVVSLVLSTIAILLRLFA